MREPEVDEMQGCCWKRLRSEGGAGVASEEAGAYLRPNICKLLLYPGDMRHVLRGGAGRGGMEKFR